MTKNITLAIDETVLAEARRYAHENDTTLNALVRGYLEQIAGNQKRVKQAMRELREMSDRSTAEVGPITWTRDDLYER
jgi:tRNA A-37 threonylcarbamoyl transferase component Bud32